MKRGHRSLENQSTIEIVPELWPLILRYLTMRQRYQYITVCKAWSLDRGIMHQSIERLARNDPLPLNLAKLVNLSSLQHYWSGFLYNSIQRGSLNRLKQLDLVENGRNNVITFGPLSLLTNLTDLKIENSVINVPGFLPHLTGLKRLSLKQTTLLRPEVDHHSLLNLTSLTDLSLYNSGISDQCLSNCSRLKHLSLEYTAFIKEHYIAQLTRLKSLTIKTKRFNPFRANVFSSLTKLRSLGVSINEKEIKTNLTHLTSLNSLELHHYPFIHSGVLSHFLHLTQLSLYNSVRDQLGVLDSHFCQDITLLTNLKALTIDGYRSTHIDYELLERLTQLTSLEIAHSINTNEMSFGHFTNLTKLSLSSQCLLCLPYKSLPLSLKELDLYASTKWYFVETSTNLRRLTNLTKLTMGVLDSLDDFRDCCYDLRKLPKLEHLSYRYTEKINRHTVSNSLNLLPLHIQVIVY